MLGGFFLNNKDLSSATVGGIILCMFTRDNTSMSTYCRNHVDFAILKRPYVYTAICLLFFWLVSDCSVSYADERAAHLHLGINLPYEVFIDESAALKIDEIAKLPDNAFQPVHSGLSLSYTRSAAWLRFNVPTRSQSGEEWWLEIQPVVLDSIQIYERGAKGWRMRQAGDRFPYQEREFAHRFFAFHLIFNELSASSRTIYLRIQTSSSLYLIANLWTPEAFAEQNAASMLHWGIYFGALIIALLFMIVMVAINRSRPYLVLTAALIINGLHVANSQGFFVSTLWANHPIWADVSIGVTASWSLAATIWTVREFLMRGMMPRWLDRLYIAAVCFSALAPLAQAFNYYGKMISLVMLLNLLGVIGGLILLGLRRQTFGQFERVMTFCLAFYLVGIFATYLPLLGYIPASSILLFYRSTLFIVFPLIASAALLIEVHQTYQNLLAEKSRALELSMQSEHILESRVDDRTQALTKAYKELHESRAFVQGILDSVSTQIAVLDSTGVIVAVNKPWRLFSIENSPDHIHPSSNTDVGTNYLEICNANTVEPLIDAIDAYDGIRGVLNGQLPTFSMEYPCHSPHELRWFLMTVTPFGLEKKGAVVVHTNITARKEAEEQIRNLAYYDTLTQLPNRRMLNDRLTLSLASSHRTGFYSALMFLDMDNFKPLNDEYGHAVGDLLLIEVASRLNRCVREVDTVARLGGDEFVVMLNGLDENNALSRAQSATVAEKIHRTLAEPYFLSLSTENQSSTIVEHHCTASIGVVLFKGHALSQEDVLKQADAAMYQAKEEGRNLICFYAPSP